MCIMHGRSLFGVGMLLAMYYTVQQVIPRSCVYYQIIEIIQWTAGGSSQCCF